MAYKTTGTKKLNVRTIGVAAGLPDGVIYSSAKNKGWSTRGGLELPQIITIVTEKRRQKNSVKVDKEEVKELREILIALKAIKDDTDINLFE